MQIKTFVLCASLAVASMTSPAVAVTAPFTETFNTNASNWLNGAAAVPTYNSSGGVDDSGYISYTSSFTSGSSGGFGAPPLQILFRANASADASGDAFVGDWLGADVVSLSLTVRHNYTSTLNLYARFDAGSGRAASLAVDAEFAIAPNTWTTIVIPITESNPPFSSYGAGNFNNVFSAIQNLQLGLYVPANTTFTDLRMDVDSVGMAVPEPTSTLLICLGLGFVALRRRRKN